MPRLRELEPEMRARFDAWAELLREARIDAELSLWVLARDAGVPSGSLSDWEKGRRTPPWWAQIALCKALRLPTAAIFPRDDLELATAELHRRKRQQSDTYGEKLEAEERRHEWADTRLRGAS